jgi:hypothetical protein
MAASGNGTCKPDCYVSTTGSDQIGNGTQANPWASLIKCFNEIDGGDTCWFEDGTYYVPNASSSGSCSSFYQGWDLGASVTSTPGTCGGSTCLNCAPYYVTRVSGGGTAGKPKTFRAVHTGGAIWKRDLTASGGANHCHSNMMVRAWVDYLKFQGIVFGNNQWIFENGASNIEFTQNEFRCGSSNDHANGGSILSGDTYDASCKSWWVHDNIFITDSTCDATAGTECVGEIHSNQVNFHHLYSQSGSVWENNDYLAKTGTPFPMGDAIGFKALPELNTIRNNYVHVEPGVSLAHGIWISGSNSIGGNGAAGQGQNVIYQNIVDGGETGIKQQGSGDRDKYYNNTFYNVTGQCYDSYPDPGQHTTAIEYFNNVCVAPSSSTVMWFDEQNTGSAKVQSQTYLNNNEYFSLGGGTMTFRNATAASSGFSAWKNYLSGTLALGPTLNENVSTENNPLLVAPATRDYHLQSGSPARSGGRGGVYSTFRGVYITGNETIGCSFHPSCLSYGGSNPPPDAPSDVENVDRTDKK